METVSIIGWSLLAIGWILMVIGWNVENESTERALQFISQYLFGFSGGMFLADIIISC